MTRTIKTNDKDKDNSDLVKLLLCTLARQSHPCVENNESDWNDWFEYFDTNKWQEYHVCCVSSEKEQATRSISRKKQPLQCRANPIRTCFKCFKVNGKNILRAILLLVTSLHCMKLLKHKVFYIYISHFPIPSYSYRPSDFLRAWWWWWQY